MSTATAAFPFPGDGYTLREWIALLYKWAATLKPGSRRNLQLRECGAARRGAVSGPPPRGAYKFATPKPGACKLCVGDGPKLLKIFLDADEITLGDYIKVTRIKRRADDDFKLTVLNKKKLYRTTWILHPLPRLALHHCNSRTPHGASLTRLSELRLRVFGRRRPREPRRRLSWEA